MSDMSGLLFHIDIDLTCVPGEVAKSFLISSQFGEFESRQNMPLQTAF
jgi:hypothetical protein